MRAGICLAGLIVVGPFLCASAPSAITTQSLISEMTNLAGLAEFPDPPFTCKQFSSYDRASKSPTENWFANGDCGQYLRVEQNGQRKEYVMMDIDGPGAIVRIWSANPKGTLRIYLDKSQTPVIEATMTDFLGGKFPGFPAPIACETSRGWNSYLPIPYARHCMVTSDEGGFYYHVNYRTYPAGTKVETFTASTPTLLAADIEKTARLLASPSKAGVAPAGKLEELLQKEPLGEGQLLEPGKAVEWNAKSGESGAIVDLYAKVTADDLPTALRKLVLSIDFDGEQTVACPLGDFFGASPGLNPYESLPLGVRKDGVMWSHWFMPFSKSAHITIRNTGDAPVHLAYRVAGTAYRWTDRSMHFHAKWRAEFDVPTRPMQDWNYLTATGKGVFVGVAFAIANPVRNWWGEGDEKIYVDGETFPSHFGTGTEDYYGYAWCCPVPFTHAYHNQPRCDGPDNYGHTAVNRWDIIDRIPFQKDFRFDMELWHWNETAKVALSVVSYWYAHPGARDGFPPIKPADLRVVEIPPYVAPRVKGALEGEEMAILEKTGTPQPQRWHTLSNETHLWWRDTKPGDQLVLGFDVPEAGKYRVIARFLSAVDYGISQLSINGTPAGDPIDLYHDGIVATDERVLGVFALPAGQNKLTIEVVGANEKAVKAYMFGLDYLRLEPVR